MGERMRHFQALTKKNWIVWKRTLGASLCELFCPIVLMALIVISRSLIDSTVVEPTYNRSKSVLMAPMIYPNYTKIGIPNNSTNPLIELMRLNATFQAFQNEYGLLGNFTNISLAASNPLAKFLPTHCAKRRLSEATPIIGVVGPQKYIDPIIKDLNSLIQSQKQVASVVNSFLTPELKERLEAAGFPAGVDVNLTVQRFKSYQEIINYVGSDQYELNEKFQGICFGFVIDEPVEDDINVKMIFSANFQDRFSQSIPNQLKTAWNEFDLEADFNSFNLYTQKGYSLIQNWVANQVLRTKSNLTNSSIALTLVPIKTDKYVKDDFSLIFSDMIPLFMLLIYILPMYRLISNLVSEKESKARESMKIMGLLDISYWLSWWFYYFVIVTIISSICICILSINSIKYSNRGLVFLFFEIYGLSLFGLAVFLQSLFSRARVAAIAGTLIYFGTSFINQLIKDPSVPQETKYLVSFLTTIAVSRGCNNLGQFEMSGVGLQIDNMQLQFENYSMSTCFIVMTISLILFFIVGLWLDNILPSSYGLRKSFFYCLLPTYWFGRGKSTNLSSQKSPAVKDIEAENIEDDAQFEAKYMDSRNYEPISQDLIKLEAEKKVLKVKDLRKTFENGFKAVNGLNVKMYNGQIFALLGHNGAGKTTTISMLTGLIDSTSGSAEVFGKDIFEEMPSIRHFLGYCPQHDILFDQLTPKEHLEIFCDFKGVPKIEQQEQIKKMLIDVDVVQYQDTVAEKLSGGSKRKLSVAIALIGGSKLVLLDEPTAGMDLSARRKLWNMLKTYKQNRIIILTTHYMDEADILGDRIGIMTSGQLVCLGSSLFLKKRYGVGYNLTMVKKFKDTNLKIEKYLQNNLGPDILFFSEVSSEIKFRIPNSYSTQFKTFFEKFDNDLDIVDIRSYGISVTSLEEVFLQVGNSETEDYINKNKFTPNFENSNIKQTTLDDFSISDTQYQILGFKKFLHHLSAQFLKRFFLYRKNIKGLVIEVFIPVILVVIGFSLSKFQFFKTQPERALEPNIFPLPQRILANQQLLVQSSFASDNIQPINILSALPNITAGAFDVSFKTYPQINVTFPTLKNISDYFNETGRLFDDDVFSNRLNNGNFPYRYGSFFILEANNKSKQFKAAVLMNLTSQDVAAAYPQFLYEAILQKALGKPNLKFKMTTQPYPITLKLKLRADSASGIFTAFVVSIGFALIPATVVSFIVNERENNLKHQQLISGMSLSAYWISNLIFDIFKGLIPSAIIIGLIYAYDLGWNNSWVMFLLYPFGVIPFSYVTSFLFSTENIAQSFTIFFHFVFAAFGPILIFILKIIDSTLEVGIILRWVFKIVPSFCLTDTILYDSSKTRLFLIRPQLKKDSDFDMTLLGGNILLLCMHFLIWIFMLLLIENGVFNCFAQMINILRKNRIAPKKEEELDQDEDVIMEEKRVAQIKPEELKIRVNKFRKVYPSLFRKPALAVERTSFGLEYGECFALLGVNGAGKSTTFKALTNEIEPSGGEISINGFNLQSQFNLARRLIGYCPQNNAIFQLMTVEEHLEYYARIKGIPIEFRQQAIQKVIQDLCLTEHIKKPSGTLSGGNKRKLCVAIAILGNPPIILLDEPSAGMDPQARRFMWHVIAALSQERKKSAVILTTHSMEEAEALSTKMGIMVQGGIFKCFGSAQHIKNKFGTGYEIEIKIKKIDDQEFNNIITKFSLEQKSSGNEIKLNDLLTLMKEQDVDTFLLNEIKEGGFGNDLVIEDNQNGYVEIRNFVNWFYIEQSGIKIVNYLSQLFETVEILQHYNDYYNIRVPRGDKTIGFLFGLIEEQKNTLKISEYSVSQTTLEQIFQTFANIKTDNDSLRKLLFKKLIGNTRSELYSEIVLPKEEK